MAGRGTAHRLSVSIVTYAPDLRRLWATLATLRKSAESAATMGVLDQVSLRIIDNGPGRGWCGPLENLLKSEWNQDLIRRGEVLSTGSNVGYGAGHNRALQDLDSDYHLVLNPDVELDVHALAQAMRYLDNNPDVGFVTPFALGTDGTRQYLAKRYPAILDLLLRGFAPSTLQELFRRRLGHYEMQGVTDGVPIKGIQIASGCFMFFRRSVLQLVGGFSPNYFLYFEDFDLSLRVSRISTIAFVPCVRITHHGGSAGSKSLRHVLLFARSAVTFYATHGWKWW